MCNEKWSVYVKKISFLVLTIICWVFPKCILHQRIPVISQSFKTAVPACQSAVIYIIWTANSSRKSYSTKIQIYIFLHIILKKWKEEYVPLIIWKLSNVFSFLILVFCLTSKYVLKVKQPSNNLEETKIFVENSWKREFFFKFNQISFRASKKYCVCFLI